LEARNQALDDDDEAMLPRTVACLVFVVHGIGQFHRCQHGTNKFHQDVSKLRQKAAKSLRERVDKVMPVSGRLEFLPLEWFEPIHVDGGVGKRLKNVTLPSIPGIRDFANYAIVDIMVYLDDEWRERIHTAIQRKMARLWELFCRRSKEFSGHVAVIGHSLGGVIMFDLMQKCLPRFTRGLLASQADSDGAEDFGCPPPRCFFAVGSPLGMLLSMRLAQRGEIGSGYFRGLDVRWPATSAGGDWRFFNVFHPNDPVAYRVEPLLNSSYSDIPPKKVLHQGGFRLHHQVHQWWQRAVGGAGKRPDMSKVEIPESETTDVLVVDTCDGKAASFFLDSPGATRNAVAVDRLDYAIQETPLESINDIFSALTSHFAYWDSEDLVQFIAEQLLQATDPEHLSTCSASCSDNYK